MPGFVLKSESLLAAALVTLLFFPATKALSQPGDRLAVNQPLSVRDDVSGGEPRNAWKGSAVGMTIMGNAPGKIRVGIVRDGLAADRAGIKRKDRLIRVGKVDLTRSDKIKLAAYFKELPPGSEIEVVVERLVSVKNSDETEPAKSKGDLVEGGGTAQPNRIRLKLVTDSKPTLDAWMVADRLKSNRVIHEFLKKHERLGQLETLRATLLAGCQKAKTPREAYELINQTIDRLDVSHTAIVPAWGYDRLTNRASGGIGLTFQRKTIDRKVRYFVVDLEAGGPAAESGLKLGDEIVQVNGVPLEDSARLVLAGEEHRHQVFMLSSDEGDSILLRIRRERDGDLEEVQLTHDSQLNANLATKNSIRKISQPLPDNQNGESVKMGYIRFWNLMSIKVDGYLKRALKNEFAECEVLIVDLRGRGGVINVAQSVDQTLKKSGKPVVAVIDRLARSAKEILAMRLKGTPDIVLVGETTCGAVTGAGFLRLPSGNALMYPVSSGERLARYSKGVNLEGRGVDPDVQVASASPYSGGLDPIMKEAKAQAIKLVKMKRREARNQ